MTLEEARRTLGLSADENPAKYLAELTAARDRIAELVRTAPNETLALRYQDGLIDFERALAVLREEADREHETVKRREWMAAAIGTPVAPIAPDLPAEPIKPPLVIEEKKTQPLPEPPPPADPESSRSARSLGVPAD